MHFVYTSYGAKNRKKTINLKGERIWKGIFFQHQSILIIKTFVLRALRADERNGDQVPGLSLHDEEPEAGRNVED